MPFAPEQFAGGGPQPFLKGGLTALQVVALQGADAAQLDDAALTLARVAGSADVQEGIAALVERRKPAFKGC